MGDTGDAADGVETGESDLTPLSGVGTGDVSVGATASPVGEAVAWTRAEIGTGVLDPHACTVTTSPNPIAAKTLPAKDTGRRAGVAGLIFGKSPSLIRQVPGEVITSSRTCQPVGRCVGMAGSHSCLIAENRIEWDASWFRRDSSWQLGNGRQPLLWVLCLSV